MGHPFARSVLALTVPMAALSVCCAEDWNRFRGPHGTGITADTAPVTWNDQDGILWKLELPGRGVSSPIITGDRVFVTCYSGYGTADGQGTIADLKRHLVCVERTTGKVLWTKTIDAVMPEDPYEPPGVTSHGYASHTPVSDGELVYVFFGKSGVYAFDLDGHEVWKASVGTGSGPQRWGSAASPVIHDNLLIVTAAEESESLVALDKSTGKTVWTSPAEGLQNTWGTPVIADTDKGPELVLAVPGEVWGFNAQTGKLRWFARGTSDSTASASVAIADGVVYAVGGRGGDAVAVKVGGKGDVNDSAVIWDANIQGRFASPIAHQGHLYTVNNDVVSCFDAKTGEQIYQERLPEVILADYGAPSDFAAGQRRAGGGRFGGSQYSSPIIADGKLYVTLKSGLVHVLEAAPEFNVLESNWITGDNSGFDATPAVSEGQLILRSGKYLYCIAGK
ncbi:MAG: PQQ-binding-like beta-propeller repeat protein [Planctomycetaceae bacterium]